MYTGARRFGLGDAESDFNNAPDAGTSDPWTLAVRAIRSVSVPMGLLRQRVDALLANVSNADASFSDADYAELQNDIQQLASYAQQLPALIAAAKSLPEYTTDLATANELTNWLAFLQDWAGSTIAAIGQLPTDVANYLSQQVSNVAKAAGNAASNIAKAAGGAAAAGAAATLPTIAIGLGVVLAVIFVVKQGERTQTGRALARHI